MWSNLTSKYAYVTSQKCVLCEGNFRTLIDVVVYKKKEKRKNEKKKGGRSLGFIPLVFRGARRAIPRLTPRMVTNCKSSDEPPGVRSHDKCDGYFSSWIFNSTVGIEAAHHEESISWLIHIHLANSDWLEGPNILILFRLSNSNISYCNE